MTAKNPRRPREPLTALDSDVVSYRGGLFTIYPTVGPRRRSWNQLRTYGPVGSRWDPHREPPADQPGQGVLYAATDVTTSLAEVFQERRSITLSGDTRRLRDAGSTSAAIRPHGACRDAQYDRPHAVRR